MTRINSNVSSLVAQNRLTASNKALNTALTRLSTGLRINSGSDDPAGLIASEALRSEITGLNKAISNTQRASQIITTADSALGQVSNLLGDIRGLVVEAASSGALSDEEIAANQLQIDSSLEAINRIAQSTTFQGRKLLDGSLDYVSTVGTVDSVQDASITRAKLGSSSLNVEVVVGSAATQGTIDASSSAFSAAAAANADTTQNIRTATVTTGTENVTITGSHEFTSIDIVDDDTVDDATGATASFDAGTGVLTITGNFTGTAATGPPATYNAHTTSDDIRDAVDGLDEFTATSTNDTNVISTAPADVASTTEGAALVTVNALNNGADYNDVAVQFVEGTAANAGADYDSEQKILTVTYDASGSEVSLKDIADDIDAHTVDGATVTEFLFSGTEGADIELATATANTVLATDLNTGKTGGEVLNGDLVFELSGNKGAETFNFGAGTSKDQIAAAVNLVSDSTGISADASGTGLALNSTAYGSDSLVAVDVISEGTGGTFAANIDSTRDLGTDIVATVNGVQANGNGQTLSINTSALALSLTVDNSGSNFSFDISGGGATFQLGPRVSSSQQGVIGIGSVSAGKLGGASGRLYELGTGQSKSLANDASGAADIIDEVINKVTSLRGQLGAFQSTTLESNLVSLKETTANLQEAESSIRDADFAQESANLTRAQILVQSGTNVLALANQNPQNVLALLR